MAGNVVNHKLQKGIQFFPDTLKIFFCLCHFGGIPQQRRGMVDPGQKKAFSLRPLTMLPCNAKIRADQRRFIFQIRHTGLLLFPLRIPVSRRMTLVDIGDIDLLPGKADGFQQFIQHLPGSPHNLKGGMFIYTLTEFASRSTKDIDFMIRRLSNELGQIQQTMEEICDIETGNDFISIEVLETEQIAVEKKYPGVKTKFRSHIGNVRVPFSIDIGIDDVIIPEPVKRKIATRLSDFEQPEIYTYSLESTIAEKLDAILQRMEATSRMKDFYDLYYLSGMFDFDGSTF